MNFSLGRTWEQYVAEQVKSGVFNNASEVVRDALRRQQEQLLQLEALRRDLAQGVASIKTGDISRTSPEDIIRQAKARKQSQ
ncbi:type II toxin-antitoxin system ParD family antitoxin [Hoeflea ulvae]|uniref:Type II toxin-antitoxin system ParD family antitoxin n=1 Tax=Hoeflea ulvae TaxID=2983764 RepID=A0ABT3YJE3_9HYPH|nr:type II toxin-antitoxin system ParD family antitoxin [Hoeflea ulvae]MCY0096024.1 type II toxin-antitoxin system ParD family antitoxin [Hoeflea ulvae]